MVASLFDLCTIAIENAAVIDQTLTDLNDAPAHIRQSIFVNLQTVMSDETNDNDDLPLCLRRRRFFDNFQHFHLIDSIDRRRYRKLLSRLLAEFRRPGTSLGATLVSLRLTVFIDQREIFDPISRSYRIPEPPLHLAAVCRLIAACRSLRRLDLRLDKCDWCEDCRCSTTDYCNRVCLLEELSKALRIGCNRAPLEALTLRNFSERHFFDCSFSSFGWLRTLDLRQCRLSSPAWLCLLESCRRTLQSLTLIGCTIDESWGDFPFVCVQLSALRSLIVDNSDWYESSGFLLSPETVRGVRRGRVCVFDQSHPDTLRRVADCLSPGTDVIFRLHGDSDLLAGVSLARKLFGHQLVELRLIHARRFPETELIDRAIADLRSIRVLTMNCCDRFDSEFDVIGGGGDRFLHRFLSDVDRARKLRRLQICWDLTTSTLRLVFRNCVSLEFLFLCPQWRSRGNNLIPDITDEDLTIWAVNGARPKHVYLGFGVKFTLVGVRRLLRNCPDDLRASFLDERRQFVPKHNRSIATAYNNLNW